MLQWEMTTNDAFRPSGHRPEIKFSVYTQMIHQAIIDLTLPKHKKDAIEWIIDPLGDGPMGFVTCCIICGYDPDIMRTNILKIAKYRQKRNLGSKPRARVDCPFPGCTSQMPVGRAYCYTCTTLLKARQKRGDKDLFAPKHATIQCIWPGCDNKMKTTAVVSHSRLCQKHLTVYSKRKKAYPDRPEIWLLPYDEFAQTEKTKKKRFIEYNGQTKTIAEWARETGLQRAAIDKRLALGWPVEKVLDTPRMQWAGVQWKNIVNRDELTR